jgi:hypothetical protein
MNRRPLHSLVNCPTNNARRCKGCGSRPGVNRANSSSGLEGCRVNGGKLGRMGSTVDTGRYAELNSTIKIVNHSALEQQMIKYITAVLYSAAREFALLL